MRSRLEKEVRFLKIYVFITTIVFSIFGLTSFVSNNKTKRFETIDVERINIIEKDGSLKMVISNKESQHPGMRDGKRYADRERSPGILFFNEEQDEVGGLGFYGNKETGGNQVFLSVDQFKNDQVMQLFHRTKKDGDNSYGIQLWDRDKNFTQERFLKLLDSLEERGFNYPKKLEAIKTINGGKPVVAPRLRLSRNYNGATGLFIQDEYGVERLRFYVDKDNNPKIEVLDEKGDFLKDLLNN